MKINKAINFVRGLFNGASKKNESGDVKPKQEKAEVKVEGKKEESKKGNDLFSHMRSSEIPPSIRLMRSRRGNPDAPRNKKHSCNKAKGSKRAKLKRRRAA